MWSYNSFYDDPNNILCHSNFKYIDKTYKNGRWIYTYDKKGGVTRKDTSADSYSRKKASWGLNPKAIEKVLSGTRLQGHRDSNQKLPVIQVLAGQKFTSENRKNIVNKQNLQKSRDRLYAVQSQNKGIPEQASKQAENEHSDKTKMIDAKAKAEREREEDQALLDDFVKKREYASNALYKLRDAKRPEEINEAGKYLEKYYDDLSEVYNKINNRTNSDVINSVMKDNIREMYNNIGEYYFYLKSKNNLIKREIIGLNK